LDIRKQNPLGRDNVLLYIEIEV